MQHILIHKKYFPNFPFCTIADGSNHCEHYFQKLHQKYGTFSTKGMCDEPRIIAGENEILSKTPGIKNPTHENIAFNAAKDPAFPLGSESPNQNKLKGRNFGNVLLN